jgi:hypothetical protein
MNSDYVLVLMGKRVTTSVRIIVVEERKEE